MEVIVSCSPNSNISSLSNFSYQTTVKFWLSDWKYWLSFSLTTHCPADSNGTILCQHIHTIVDPHIITNAFCIMFLPHLRKIIHYIIHVVHVWYGINIVCIGHFTPPVDLSDRPFKTERDRLSCSARQQRETTLLIYLKSTGRYERPIAYMFSFCWQFLRYIQLL